MSDETQKQPGNPFDPTAWKVVEGFEDLTDITYHRSVELGCVRVAFDRPEVLNAFRPHTVDELYRVLDHARRTPDVGVVLLTAPAPQRATMPSGSPHWRWSPRDESRLSARRWRRAR